MVAIEEQPGKNIDAMEVVEDEEESKHRRLISELKRNLTLLEHAVVMLESRFTTRVLRTLPSTRKGLTASILSQIITEHCSNTDNQKSFLLEHLGEADSKTDAMQVDQTIAENSAQREIDVYLHLLVIVYLLDKEDWKKGMIVANEAVRILSMLNRRTMDQLAARIYFYHALFYEHEDRLKDIRPLQIKAHRTATLRRDDEVQATLLNLLLRNYFHYKLYDQANKLESKSTFPENASNNQAARYAYYIGRIQALQLEYSSAHDHLNQAIRKAPQNKVAAGFQQTVNKFSIVVQLLMGEIPDRSLFRQPILKKALLPYLGITQAVRVGDLKKFTKGLQEYSSVFKRDDTYTLILRLRHNVIKTGIRMISLSYSKISLKDICHSLHLDSEEDAEFIVAKAIKDGVIDATLDHARGFMKSKELVDIYSTKKPQDTFNLRITFCLNLHNESVKAMRYPIDAHRKDFENAEDAKSKREIALELAEIEDEDEFA